MKNNIDVRFDASTHTYTDENGIKIPSVTQVLRFLNYDIASGADRYAKEQAGIRGSRVHAACLLYDYEREEAEIDPDIAGYVRSYATFLEEYGIEDWTLMEAPLASRIVLYPSGTISSLAGTIDRFGKIDGKNVLVDIKTGTSKNTKYFACQLSAYKLLLERHGYDVDSVAILTLTQSGYKYKIHKLYDDEDCGARLALWNCMRIHHYLRGEA